MATINWRNAMSDYGIKHFVDELKNTTHTQVMLGDGLTRLTSISQEGVWSGIQVCKDNSINLSHEIVGGIGNQEVNSNDFDKVNLIFTSTKSIDVAIERLIEARGMLQE